MRLGAQCRFSFYGLASSAYAAALALETALNRIMTLAAQHTVPRSEYDRRRRAGEISVCRGAYTKMARVSYCDGVAAGPPQRVREAAPPPASPSAGEAASAEEEETRLACVSERVERSVLAKRGIRISAGKGRVYARTQRRHESYAAGRRDSSQIELQQGALA